MAANDQTICPHCNESLAPAALRDDGEIHCPNCNKAVTISHDVDETDPNTTLPHQSTLDGQSTLHTSELVDASDVTKTHLPDTLGHVRKPAPAQHSADSTEFGDYELIEVIARGGMGVVYKARQKRANRVVALKMIISGNLADNEEVDRFYTEAEAAANLDHPNIVPVYDVGQVDGQHYFSMGYVDGESLRDRIRNGPMECKEAATVVRRIADAVGYAHENGIIHRDLKSANVLLDQSGRPRVTDFGLAKQMDSDSDLTASGQVMGTPSYMPPEQAAGKLDEIGPASDVYSLGAVLYELLIGRPPFQAASALDVLRQVFEKEPVAPRQLDGKIDKDLETICLKCLQKDQRRRFGSAHELEEELQRYLDGEPIKSRPIGTTARVWRWCRRRPHIAGLIAAIALSLVAGMSISTYFAILADRRAQRAQEATRIAVTTLESVINTVQQKLRTIPEAREIRRELLRNSLADLQKVSGEVQSQSRVDRNTASVLIDLARLFEELGDDEGLNAMDAAETHYKRAVEILQRLSMKDPDDLSLSLEHARALNALGNYYLTMNKLDMAENPLRASLTIRRGAVMEYPDDLRHQFQLSNALTDLADYYALKHDFKTALSVFQEAIPICERLVKSDPKNLEYQHRIGETLEKTGDACHDMGDNDAALELFQRSFAIRGRLYKLDPDSSSNQDEMSFSYERLGNHWMKVGDAEQAREMYEKMLEFTKLSIQSDPSNRLLLDGLAVCYDKIAAVNSQLGDQQAVQAAQHEAAKIRSRLAQKAQ